MAATLVPVGLPITSSAGRVVGRQVAACHRSPRLYVIHDACTVAAPRGVVSQSTTRLDATPCTDCLVHSSVEAAARSIGVLVPSRSHRRRCAVPRAATNDDEDVIDVEPSRSSASTPTAEEGVGQASSPPSPTSEASPDADVGPFRVRGDVAFDISLLSLGLVLRGPTGALVNGHSASLEADSPDSDANTYGIRIAGKRLVETSKPGKLPEKPIELYEFEGCPFCRKVREAVTILDLDVLYYPCPQGGPTFRAKAYELGGKRQFPYMVDPNTGVSMYESDDIIKYLFTTYGDGEVPIALRLGTLTILTCGLAVGVRGRKGSKYTPAKMPEIPLEVWGYEASPFCRLVRECLGELELPHILHSVARGSPKRQKLFEKWGGRFQVPYLEDPNTGVKMFECAAIVEYLRSTYALPSPAIAAAAPK